MSLKEILLSLSLLCLIDGGRSETSIPKQMVTGSNQGSAMKKIPQEKRNGIIQLIDSSRSAKKIAKQPHVSARTEGRRINELGPLKNQEVDVQNIDCSQRGKLSTMSRCGGVRKGRDVMADKTQEARSADEQALAGVKEIVIQPSPVAVLIPGPIFRSKSENEVVADTVHPNTEEKLQ
ncbi:uncharacterized protein RB166_018976 [Leptodactylus fuscus]